MPSQYTYQDPWDDATPGVSILRQLIKPLGDYVCPLYVRRRGQGYLIGTGVPIQVGPTMVIATAAHVLHEAEGQSLLTFGRDQPFELLGERRAYGYIRDATVDADLGIVLLDAHERGELMRRYSATSLGDFGDVAESKSVALYILVGYPHTKNKPTPPRRYGIDTTAIFVMSDRQTPLTKPQIGLHADVHFALHLRSAAPPGRKLRHVPKMAGMSGGGVWRYDGSDDIAENAAPKLVGVGIAYDQVERVVTCTRIDGLLGMLNTG